MKIILSDVEKKLAVYIAKARYSAARESGVPDLKVGPQDNWQTDLEGVGAELAFCKHHNVYPDFEIDGYGVSDCISKTLGLVDVKSTKYRQGRLLVIKKKMDLPVLPNTYVLMIGEFPEYEFAGYISAKELLTEKNLINLGYGLTYGVDQDQLHENLLDQRGSAGEHDIP